MDQVRTSKSPNGIRRPRTILDVMVAETSPDDWLRPSEVAAMFGISVGTLKNWRLLKKGPPYSKPSARVVYKRADVDAFQLARTIDPKERVT